MYNKIFTKILDSSIWSESVTTRIVWVTFLAAMDEDGFVQFAGVDNVAARARVSRKHAEAAIAILEAPDADSADPDNDGRRIERVQGGWLVLNSEKYRQMVTRVVVREQTRERVRRFRERKKTGNAHVTPSKRGETQSEEYSEARSPNNNTRGGKKIATIETQAALQQAVTELSELTGVDYIRILERATNGHLRTGKKRCEPCLQLTRISQDHADRSLLDVNTAIAVEKSR